MSVVKVEEPKEQIAKRPIAIGDKGLRLTTLDDAFRFAKYVVESGLAPKGVTRPEQALIAMQAGAELGFSPMRALAAITVINGRAGLMGDAALAKIYESGTCSVPPVSRLEGEGDERRGVVRFQRSNMPSVVEVEFSVAEAKRARLWGKTGPWTEYPDDMLIWRAVGRMCKRYFGDVTMGLVVAEELRDYPTEAPVLVAPTEPDPLLAEAEVVEVEAMPPTVEAVISAPTAGEAENIRALDKLEGAILTAETEDELNRVMADSEALRASLPTKERQRITKLYQQNLLGCNTKTGGKSK